tara:strand:+ start:857 stop:1582 length:726 start_codon:yes stop_codon:yes gene_type:complete
LQPCDAFYPITANPGPGFQIVTGTFQHQAAKILDIGVESESKPIGTTPNHPFWSVDRQAFVRADSLTVGERLQNLNGITTVTSITPRGPPEPVFNLEVQVKHTYYVADTGVLVHNGTPCPIGAGDETVTLYKTSQKEIGGLNEFDNGYIGRWFAKDGWISKAYAHPNVGTHEDFASAIFMKKSDYERFLSKFEQSYVGSDVKGTIRKGIELEIPKPMMKFFNDLIIDKKLVPWLNLPDFGG